MKIRVSKDSACGGIFVPAGEYWVALRHESREMVLVSKGKDLVIPATRRTLKCKTKTTQISFFCGGGATWSLVVATPKYGEWVSFIEVESGSRKKE